MIQKCTKNDFDAILSVINDGAQAYKGVIPDDCWNEPYMTSDYLRHELDAGVVFWGWQNAGQLVGVMGFQNVGDVTLIRHAYVRSSHQRQGIGGKLIRFLQLQATQPTLVGTWRAAEWAIRFYEKHGFQLVADDDEKDMLLMKYWTISERQIETSVVLADRNWFACRSENNT